MYTITTMILAPLLATAFIGTAVLAEELSFAHFLLPAHIITSSVVEPLSARLGAASGGELSVPVYPGGELGQRPVEQYAGVVQGVADMAWSPANDNSQQFSLSMIIELPGVVDAANVGERHQTMWCNYDDFLKAEFQGTRVIAVWMSEPNALIISDKDVRNRQDVKGLKIRGSGAFLAQVIEALGATPVQMSANDRYKAMQIGLINESRIGGSAIQHFKINELARSFTTGASRGNILHYVAMYEARDQGLTEAQKAVVYASVDDALSALGEAAWNNRANETIDMPKAASSKTVNDLTADEAAAFSALRLAVTDKVVAELEARGRPASDLRAVMIGQ